MLNIIGSLASNFLDTYFSHSPFILCSIYSMELEDSVVLETDVKVGSGGRLGILNISSIIIRVKTYWFSFYIRVVILVDSVFLNAFW